VSDAEGRPLAPALARWLAAVAPSRARGEVRIALVSDRRIRTLNRTFRRIDAVTHVLSFPADAAPPAKRSRRATADRGPHAVGDLGDIVIATGVARRQARAAGHDERTEHRVLALHGLLHLLGYDHEQDEGAMARTERRLRRKGGLREGLIERS
jgi:probable rRNA maturation factor